MTEDGEAQFNFVTRWFAPATCAQVWSVLSDAAGWPQWWPGIAAAEVVRDGDSRGLGRRTALRVASPLGYRLRFGVQTTEIDPGRFAAARVVGDLRGTGTWSVVESDHGTTMWITWRVSSQRRLVRALRPVAPWAHATVMAAGERGLRQHLGLPV